MKQQIKKLEINCETYITGESTDCGWCGLRVELDDPNVCALLAEPESAE